MKIVIVGAGEVGFHIAEHLVSEHKDVVLIEKNPEKAKYAATHLDCIVVTGEGSSIDTLRQAGTAKADVFISATDSDEVNMVTCLVVDSEFNVPTRIARVRNLEYSKTRVFSERLAGIDYLVNPEIEATRAIIDTVEHGAVTDVFVFRDTDVQMRTLFVDETSPFKDLPMKDARQRIPEDYIVAGISRGDEIIIPTGNTYMRSGDRLYIVASSRTIDRILRQTGRVRRKLKNIVVVGGGKIGRYVVEALLGRGRRVKFIDRDYERCKVLSEQFPDALVINGDISDESIFEEEQLDGSDLIIACTQNEELNILASIYAKSRGIKRAVCLVNKLNYLTISSSLGIDATVSPKVSSVDAVLRFIRRGNVKTFFSVFDGKAEVIEFSIGADSDIAGTAIKDLRIPTNCLIVAVNRESRHIIPDGNFVVEAGDTVITFAKREAVDSLEDLFEG